MEDVAKIHLCSVLNTKYVATRKLGDGGFGSIYELALLSNPTVRYACKTEITTAAKMGEEALLKVEIEVLQTLTKANAQHVGRFIESGRTKDFNFVIMSLLGMSINDIRKQLPEQKFSLFTCACVAIQCIDSLKEFHDCGYVHRDVKPANFAAGRFNTATETIVYLLDFGLARTYREKNSSASMTPTEKQALRRPRKNPPFRGTPKYSSLNAHAREEQGRHDDLWSLLYMLVEMFFGELPWKHLKEKEEIEREKQQCEKTLFEKCPKEFAYYLAHIKYLNYGMHPDYDLLRNLMFQWMRKNKLSLSERLDWQAGGRHSDVFHPRRLWRNRRGSKTKGADFNSLLKPPTTDIEIQDMDATAALEKEDFGTNSSHDDTVVEELGKSKMMSPAPSALSNCKSNVSTALIHTAPASTPPASTPVTPRHYYSYTSRTKNVGSQYPKVSRSAEA